MSVERASKRLREQLSHIAVQKGIPTPQPGNALILRLIEKGGDSTFELGEDTIETLAVLAGLSTSALRAQLDACQGQGVLSFYIAGKSVFTAILDVPRGRN